MAKAPADTIKYIIYGDITIDGVVEKPDVVGAIFGQAEGLLGEELELRDLQKTGRIGRIDVDIVSKAGKSTGRIIVPSSLDMVETSIIASAIEMVDRVGPCNAKVKITNVEDTRSAKRKLVIERAKEILKKLMSEQVPESQKIEEEVRKLVQLSEITTYEGLPAGPGIKDSETVIVVEGRADVLNLLRCDIKNVIAVEGTNISDAIVKLSKEKNIIAFFDGDRGGDILLNELMQKCDIDFVARAPAGKEVEDLGKKEVIMALRKKIPATQISKASSGLKHNIGEEEEKKQKSEVMPNKTSEEQHAIEKENEKEIENVLRSHLADIKGRLTSKFFDKDLKLITEIEIKNMLSTIQGIKPYGIVFDGIITQRLVDTASENGVKYIVGVNKALISNSKGMILLVEENK